MTPEQIDAATNGALWLHDQINTYGPGLALAALGVAFSWTCAKTGAWRKRRRDLRATRRQLRTERQQMARLSAAINNAPLIPTQPGHDQDALNTCWASWNADIREEDSL